MNSFALQRSSPSRAGKPKAYIEEVSNFKRIEAHLCSVDLHSTCPISNTKRPIEFIFGFNLCISTFYPTCPCLCSPLGVALSLRRHRLRRSSKLKFFLIQVEIHQMRQLAWMRHEAAKFRHRMHDGKLELPASSSSTMMKERLHITKKHVFCSLLRTALVPGNESS